MPRYHHDDAEPSALEEAALLQAQADALSRRAATNEARMARAMAKSLSTLAASRVALRVATATLERPQAPSWFDPDPPAKIAPPPVSLREMMGEERRSARGDHSHR